MLFQLLLLPPLLHRHRHPKRVQLHFRWIGRRFYCYVSKRHSRGNVNNVKKNSEYNKVKVYKIYYLIFNNNSITTSYYHITHLCKIFMRNLRVYDLSHINNCTNNGILRNYNVRFQKNKKKKIDRKYSEPCLSVKRRKGFKRKSENFS